MVATVVNPILGRVQLVLIPNIGKVELQSEVKLHTNISIQILKVLHTTQHIYINDTYTTML